MVYLLNAIFEFQIVETIKKKLYILQVNWY